MMKWARIAAISLLALGGKGSAPLPSMPLCGEHGGGFLPENSLNIPPRTGRGLSQALVAGASGGGIDEAAYNRVIDQINAVYTPIIRAKGGTLTFNRLWADGTVNASATRSGNLWIVTMYGGLARHPVMNADGFALVACHETGHHIGGVPHYSGQWAANEGQADYFATLKCLRRVWQGDDNVNIVAGMNVPQTISSTCEKQFGSAQSIAICKRVAMAGQVTAELMRSLANDSAINVDTPDPSRVAQTYDPHPRAQCRLDTYFAGSVCAVDYQVEIGQNDVMTGACAEEKNDKIGFRPRCWYAPGGSGGNTAGVPPAPLINGSADTTANNPNLTLMIQYDVSGIADATGIYIEFLQAGREFAQPNGDAPDPSRIKYWAVRGPRGTATMIPAQVLPGWGVYRYRVIALGGNGERAVSHFSNGSTLRMQPGMRLTRL